MSPILPSTEPRFHRARPLGRVLAALAGLALSLAACSDPASPGAGRSNEAAPSERSVAPLVGTWERETRCEEVVSMLTEAGLDGWVPEVVVGEGFVPRVRKPDQLADPANPCKGAVPREHSHFFTEDGRFGSLDWNGDTVDDGTYELVDGDRFVVSKEFPDVTFSFSIDGDTIRFEPEIPTCSPDCFEALWSVMVAYPGEEWNRVE